MHRSMNVRCTLACLPTLPLQVKIKDEFGRDVHQQICKVIAADGGYRTESIPFPPEGVQMGIAERYEVACNFAPFAGRRLYLW